MTTKLTDCLKRVDRKRPTISDGAASNRRASILLADPRFQHSFFGFFQFFGLTPSVKYALRVRAQIGNHRLERLHHNHLHVKTTASFLLHELDEILNVLRHFVIRKALHENPAIGFGTQAVVEHGEDSPVCR